MNWEAISAIGEVLGAIAVVVTLAYLAVQVRQNTLQQRVESQRALSQEFNRFIEGLYDLDRWKAVARALADWDGVSAQEQHVANVFLMRYTQMIQSNFWMWEAGTIDEMVYKPGEDFFVSVLANPGARKWWELFGSTYNASFQRRIRGKLDSADVVPTLESVPFWNQRHWLES